MRHQSNGQMTWLAKNASTPHAKPSGSQTGRGPGTRNRAERMGALRSPLWSAARQAPSSERVRLRSYRRVQHRALHCGVAFELNPAEEQCFARHPATSTDQTQLECSATGSQIHRNANFQARVGWDGALRTPAKRVRASHPAEWFRGPYALVRVGSA